MERKVLDVIDVGADLAPYGFSAIYSGVGTGKNTFIEGLLTEDGTFKGGLSSRHRVLLVTSRKAKVEETFKRHGNGIKNFTNKHIITTLLHIERSKVWNAQKILC